MPIDPRIANLNIIYYEGKLSHSDSTKGTPKDIIYDFADKIYYAISGCCAFELISGDDKSRTVQLSPGDMLFIPARMKHKILSSVTEGVYHSTYWIRFHFDVADTDLFSFFSLPQVVHTKGRNKILSSFKTIINSNNSAALLPTLKCKAEIFNIILLFLEQAQAAEKDDLQLSYEKKPEFGLYVNYDKIYSIDKIVRLINENLNHSFTLEELANLAHLHPVYFTRVFKEQIGLPPMKYIMQKRMHYAQSCINSTTMPIPEIMKNINFIDRAHFSQVFKKYYGTTPTKMRSKHTAEILTEMKRIEKKRSQH